MQDQKPPENLIPSDYLQPQEVSKMRRKINLEKIIKKAHVVAQAKGKCYVYDFSYRLNGVSYCEQGLFEAGDLSHARMILLQKMQRCAPICDLALFQEIIRKIF